jgi:DNA (cytosine-5)-methyltransferase 1
VTFDGGEISIDCFAGGGGASTGMAAALGRSPAIAINHWGAALQVHAANHPETLHLTEDIWAVDPVAVVAGRLVGAAWFSPDCTHFSRAKGGKPVTNKIRGLPWSIVRMAAAVRPEVMFLENVKEMMQWGPLHKTHSGGCGGELGKPCPAKVKNCHHARPIKERRGQTFRALVRRLERLGYVVRWWVLRACDYGAPTSRERFYLVARRDGIEPRCPARTHGPGRPLPWRTAAEIIDWSIPCASIFDRAKPHVPATRRRLAKGMRKFVLEAAQPFLLHLTHGDRHAPHSVDDPVPTVTAANRGEQALAVPFMIHRSNGERPGQEPRTYDVRAPHPTAVAQGIKTSPVLAFLAKGYSERTSGGWNGGSGLDAPIGVVTAKDHHSLVAASLLRYNGKSVGQPVDVPIGTLDATDRYALAEYAATEWSDEVAAKARRVYHFLVEEGILGPWLDHEAQIVRLPGTDLVIWDIGMRMLTPGELFAAQGFPADYQFTHGADGKELTKTAQVRLAGNSVCPPVAEALVRANTGAHLPLHARGAHGRQESMWT